MRLATPSLASLPAPRRTIAPARRFADESGGFKPTEVVSTTDLTRQLSRETAATDRAETSMMLFLSGCAVAFVAGCAVHVERFVAGWDSFETFVRALLG